MANNIILTPLISLSEMPTEEFSTFFFTPLAPEGGMWYYWGVQRDIRPRKGLRFRRTPDKPRVRPRENRTQQKEEEAKEIRTFAANVVRHKIEPRPRPQESTLHFPALPHSVIFPVFS